jgi:hypothetical protein
MLARIILAMLLSRTVVGVVNQCHVLDSNKERRYVDPHRPLCAF